MASSDQTESNKMESVSPGSQVKDLTPKNLSLLERVRSGLKADANVYYAGEARETEYISDWVEVVDVCVAPQTRIYEPEKLDQFVDKLLPDLPRTFRDRVHQIDSESNMTVGALYFDETLGTITTTTKTTVTATDPETLRRAGIPEGESTDTAIKSLQRRTIVRVYPDANLASLVAQYLGGVQDRTIVPDDSLSNLKYHITPDQLRKLQDAHLGTTPNGLPNTT